MSFVLALEGLPGSGKTTLKNDLSFGELVIDRVEQILPDDPDRDEHLTLQDIYRSDTLKTLRATGGASDIAILDRYYLSTLSYQYAHDKTFGTQNYPKAATRYTQALAEGSIVEPDITIYIDTPLAQSYLRKGRTPNSDIWTNENFLRAIEEFYKRQRGIILVDGSLEYNKVKRTIINIVEGMLNV